MNNGRSFITSRAGWWWRDNHDCIFLDVISVENLLWAWRHFSRGKRSKKDVVEFELRLEENLFKLHEDLESGSWQPDPYRISFIQDPKPRKIHEPSVRDRVLYQAIYSKLNIIFDESFIHDSYASRKWKGTHKGIKRFEIFARKITANYTKVAYVLKCDIRKFFDNIDHNLLLSLVRKRVSDEKFMGLMTQIIESFSTKSGIGVPLGNVTSQICSNIFLNELDQYAKHCLKARYYIRYCDDFVILHESKRFLENCILKLDYFLKNKLKLELHPNKISLRKIHNGTDFLGYVSLPHRKILRTKTKKRIIKKIEKLSIMLQRELISQEYFDQIMSSYKGILTHCKSEKLKEQIGLIAYC
ncbi:MAG: reverse transcriptase domain-containing protein [Candidatus Paceibacterota bacterium]